MRRIRSRSICRIEPYDSTTQKTSINAKVQLGPGWSASKETVPAGFSVWFYNEQGERIGISDGATTSLVPGESQNVQLLVNDDVTRYAYATVHIGMLHGRRCRPCQTNIGPSEELILMIM